MSARGVYTHELEDRYDFPGKYHPHWEPHSLLDLGDVGRSEDGDWQKTGDASTRGLGDLGTPEQGTAAPISFTAGEDIQIRASLSASTKGFEFIGKAKAGIKITFGHTDSLVVVAPDTRYVQLPDDNDVAEQMIEAWKRKDLKFGDQVAVGVLKTAGGMVLASEEGGASVDVTTDAEIKEGMIDIAEVKGRLSIVNKSKMAYAHPFPEGFVLARRSLKIDRRAIRFWKPEVHPELLPSADDDFVCDLPEVAVGGRRDS
jgi:hypothetical protein